MYVRQGNMRDILDWTLGENKPNLIVLRAEFSVRSPKDCENEVEKTKPIFARQK